MAMRLKLSVCQRRTTLTRIIDFCTSQQLHQGGVVVAKGVVMQLEEIVALLGDQSKVWLGADDAYYQKKVVDFCDGIYNTCR